jgi:F-type H+-transporting ATPase subunit delta
MLRHFEQLYKEYKRVADAKLYSATQLSPQKLSEISGILSKKLDKIINLELVVDPSLLAGFRVEVDGFVFDSSIKNQLAGLKKQLLGAERYSALY